MIKKILFLLNRRIARLKKEIENCRGCGNVSSDFARMSQIRAEIRGIKYAIGVILRGME